MAISLHSITYFWWILIASFLLSIAKVVISKNACAQMDRGEVKLDDWPFFAFVKTPSKLCPAIVVGDNMVMTAISCLENDLMDHVRVTVGKVEISESEAHEGTYKVAKYCFPTEKYEMKNVILLKTTESFDKNTGKAFIVDGDMDYLYRALDADCYFLGLVRRNNTTKAWFSQAKYVDCQRQPWQFCFRMFNKSAVTPCKNDIGGALICKYNEENKIFLVGLLSQPPERPCRPLGSIYPVKLTNLTMPNIWNDCRDYFNEN